MSDFDDGYRRGKRDGLQSAVDFLTSRKDDAESRTLIFRSARITESASAVADELSADIAVLNSAITLADKGIAECL